MTLDYRVYHAINLFVSHHAWIGRTLSEIENDAVPLLAVATFALWLLDRPGAQRKWKLASASALAAAAAASSRTSSSHRDGIARAHLRRTPRHTSGDRGRTTPPSQATTQAPHSRSHSPFCFTDRLSRRDLSPRRHHHRLRSGRDRRALSR
jgi:hypothetical protein